MSNTPPVYSSLMHCLYDQDRPIGRRYDQYSIFRAIDARDVTQTPTARPYVHDFAVLWDSDHDTRIIPVLEEMLMAGILPGVQFIGEHKGTLTVILAAKTYFLIDIEAFTSKVATLTQAAGDCWTVRVGMYDHNANSLRTGHQCDFQEIIGLPEQETHAYLYSIDSTWNLGTKAWGGIGAPVAAPAPGSFFANQNRYVLTPDRRV